MGRPFAEEGDSASVAPWERGDEATFGDERLEAQLLAALHNEPGQAAGVDPAWFQHPLHADIARGMVRLVAKGESRFEGTALFAAIGRKASEKLDGLVDNGKAIATLGAFMDWLRRQSGYATSAERLKADVRANWVRRQVRAAAGYSNGGSPSEGLAELFAKLDEVRRAPGGGAGFKLIPFGEWKAAGAKPDYLVKGMLQRGYCYGLTGQTGHGKTAVALRLSLSVGSGGRFGRHQCKPGRVLYLAGENPDDLRFRCQAVASVEDIAEANLFIVEGTYSIGEVLPAARAAVDAIGGVDLVIVDTSPAFFFGEAGVGENPENNNAAMGEHAKTLRQLTRLPGSPTVVALCHPVKDAVEDNLNPRGASSFKNELDGNLTLWKHDESMVRMSQNKIRGVEFAPIEFELEVLKSDACTDADGEVMPQVSAVFASDQLQNEREREQERQENAIVVGLGEGKEASVICREEGWIGPDAEPERWRFSRLARRLASAEGGKLLVKDRRGWALTKPGQAVYDKLKAERDEGAELSRQASRYETEEAAAKFQVTGMTMLGTACAACGDASGNVFLIRDKYGGVTSTPLHERCAGAWFNK